MSDGSKGAAVGLTAAIGLGGMSLADDVLRAGARGLSGVGDDVMRSGAKLGSSSADGVIISEGALEAAGHTLDDAGRMGTRGFDPSSHYAPQPKLRPGAKPPASARGLHVGASDEGVNWGAELAEQGVDLSLEFIDLPEQAAPPERYIEATHHPQLFNLIAEPDAWTRALTSEAFEDAPLVFVGVALGARDDALLIEGERRTLAELGAVCWERGTTCVFVGCESGERQACAESSARQFYRSRGRGHPQVSDFVAEYSFACMDQLPQPAYVASAGGSETRSIEHLRKRAGGPAD